MKIEDMALAINQIKVDIKERLGQYFVETDHNFALENYDYITKNLENDSISKNSRIFTVENCLSIIPSI